MQSAQSKPNGKSFSDFLKAIEASAKAVNKINEKNTFNVKNDLRSNFKDLSRDNAANTTDAAKESSETEDAAKITYVSSEPEDDSSKETALKNILAIFSVPEDIANLLISFSNTTAVNDETTQTEQKIDLLTQKIDDILVYKDNDFEVSNEFLTNIKNMANEIFKDGKFNPDILSEKDIFNSFKNVVIAQAVNIQKGFEMIKTNVPETSRDYTALNNLIDMIDGKDIKLESFTAIDDGEEAQKNISDILLSMKRNFINHIVNPEIKTQAAEEKPVSENIAKLSAEIKTAVETINKDETVKIKPAEQTKEVKISSTHINNIASQNAAAGTTNFKTNDVEIQAHISEVATKISQIIAQNKDGKNFELKIKLMPENLGEMIVKVTFNKGNVNLNILTDNKLAQKEMIDQQNALRAVLESHELNLTGFDISSRNNNNNQFNMFEESQRQRENNENKQFLFGINETEQRVDKTEYNTDTIDRIKNYIRRSKYYKTV